MKIPESSKALCLGLVAELLDGQFLEPETLGKLRKREKLNELMAFHDVVLLDTAALGQLLEVHKGQRRERCDVHCRDVGYPLAGHPGIHFGGLGSAGAAGSPTPAGLASALSENRMMRGRAYKTTAKEVLVSIDLLVGCHHLLLGHRFAGPVELVEEFVHLVMVVRLDGSNVFFGETRHL